MEAGNTVFTYYSFCHHLHSSSSHSLYFEADNYNLSFRRCTFDSNRAMNNGGAAYFESSTSNVIFRDCRISANKAGNLAGAFYLSTNITRVTFQRSRIIANFAASSGGAVFSDKQNHNLVVAGTEVFNNSAGTSNGGSLHIGQNHENVAILSSKAFDNLFKVQRNYQSSSSGSYSLNNFSSPEAEGFVIVFDSSTSLGEGDMLVIYDSNMVPTFNSSESGGFPGVTFPPLKLSMNTFFVELRTIAVNRTNTESSSSTSSLYGFKLTAYPVYQSLGVLSSFEQNTALAGLGGAVYMAESTLSPVVIGASFVGNQASNGGGLCLGSYNGGMVVHSSRFQNNSASSGGGLYIGSENYGLCFYDVVIDENRAVQGGGVFFRFSNGNSIRFSEKNQIVLSNSSLTGNSANNGAAVYCDSGNVVDMSNIALSRNVAATDGGGLFLNTKNQLNGFEVSVDANIAALNGGGVYASIGNEISMMNATILSNKAGLMGGGLCLLNDSDLSLSGQNVFDSNEASTGGGILLRSSILWESQQPVLITFRNNKAHRGSAVAVADIKPSSRHLHSITFEANTATLGGTFFWLYHPSQPKPTGHNSSELVWLDNVAPYGNQVATQPTTQDVDSNYSVLVYNTYLAPGEISTSSVLAQY